MPRRICPRCGSKKTSKILYGIPAMDDRLQEQLDKGEVVLGECCITGCDHVYHCNKCKKDFGAPTTELEADAISFYFKIGGFFGDNYLIMIIKSEDGAAVNYYAGEGYLPEEIIPKEELSSDEWQAFIHKIFHCYIADWKKRYVDQHVVDGTQWELEVSFVDSKPIKVYGNNKYPVHWGKFIKTVNTLGHHIS